MQNLILFSICLSFNTILFSQESDAIDNGRILYRHSSILLESSEEQIDSMLIIMAENLKKNPGDNPDIQSSIDFLLSDHSKAMMKSLLTQPPSIRVVEFNQDSFRRIELKEEKEGMEMLLSSWNNTFTDFINGKPFNPWYPPEITGEYSLSIDTTDRKVILGFDCYKVVLKAELETDTDNPVVEGISVYEMYVTEKIKCPFVALLNLPEKEPAFFPLEIKHYPERFDAIVELYEAKKIQE